MKNMRKLLSLLLSLTLCVSLVMPAAASELTDLQPVEEAVAEPVYVAQVGETKYETLADAIAQGGTVTLLSNTELDTMITVPSGANVVLDLNGYTITGTDTTTKNFSLLDNRGTLKITSSVVGGKMTLTATTNNGWNRYSAVVANNPGGNLTIESNVTLEHLGGTDMTYGVDNLTNGKGTSAVTTINGGTIKSNYRGIRQFLNGVEATNIVTINGGTVEGANKAIFFHDPSTNANSGKLTVGANADINGGVYLFVTEGSTEWPVEVSIAAAALDAAGVTTKNVPAGYAVINVNDTYTVCPGIAQIGTTYYKSLQAAVDAANEGETITLLTDVNITDTVNVAKELTLDLAGFTLTGTPAAAEAYAVIKNTGNLTITGNGMIHCNHTLAGSTSYAVNAILNCGTLTINNGTIKNTSTASNQIGYAIDNNSTSANAVLVINGGAVAVSGSYYYDGIRQFCNSTTLENSVSVAGGTVSSIWLQNPSDGAERNTKDVKGSVSVSGGTVSSLYLEPSSNFAASITDGTIGSISAYETAEGRDLSGFITGGTFEAKPDDKFVAEGYGAIQVGEVYKVHKHEVKAVAAVDKQCTTPGVKAHYACEGCGLKYSDAAGTTLITDESTLVIPASHTLEKVEAVQATCTEAGAEEHYKCACGALFSDAEGETAVTEKDLEIAILAHTLKPVAEVAATYTAPGVKAHYACQNCTAKFFDAEGVTKATDADLEIAQLIEVVGDKAEVSEGAVDKAIEEAVTSGDKKDVVLDLTNEETVGEVATPVTKAEIPVAAIEKVAEADATLTLTKEDATVTLDTKALDAVAEAVKNEGATNVTLVVQEIEAEDLTAKQQEAVEEVAQEKTVVKVISAELLVQTAEGEKKVGTEADGGFGGGTVTVKIPFTPEVGFQGSDYSVIYIADDGAIQNIKTEYKDGCLVVELEHFSDYVVVNNAAKSDDEDNSGSGESEAQPEPTTKPAEKPGKPAPDTGDNADVAGLVALLVASGLMAAAMLVFLKKFRA